MKRTSLALLITMGAMTFAGACDTQTLTGGAAPMNPQQAFEVLEALNERKKLIPSSFATLANHYAGLRPENCVGLSLKSGARIIVESTGTDYGMFSMRNNVGGPQLAFLYSEAPFTLQAKPLDKGSYMVFGFAEALVLEGEKSVEVPLPLKLETALSKEKPTKRPRVTLSAEGSEIRLTVGEINLALQVR